MWNVINLIKKAVQLIQNKAIDGVSACTILVLSLPDIATWLRGYGIFFIIIFSLNFFRT